MRIFTLLFILFTLSLPAMIVDGIAILVKEEPITLYDIEQAMQEERLPVMQAADLLIRQKLESMEIRQRDIKVTPVELFDRISQMAAQNNLTVSQLYDAVRSTQGLTQDAFREKLTKSMLTQKLYNDIAFSTIDEPGEAEMREYYRLHAERFSHSDSFDVMVYTSTSQKALEGKIANPILQVSGVNVQEATLPYAQIEPRLADLLGQTKRGEYTPILPDPKGGFVAFYIRNKSMPVMLPFETVKSQVQETMMADEREQTLKDYFDRARMNAEIKIIRLPQR